MNSDLLNRDLIKSIILCCGLFCALVVSGCSDSNNSGTGDMTGNNTDTQANRLTGCADTDSCFSNPTLQIGGNRPADVMIPSDYTTTTRYPLIILLHGFGATGIVQTIYLGLDVRVDSKQYILVLPDGTENAQGWRFWNATPACCAGTPEERQIDDVAYIRSLVEEAVATYSIDASRISLMGHSNGGFMALRMVCEASDIITSVVSLAGSTFADDASCAPAEYPVSVLAMHGDADETVPYEGIQTPNLFPGAKETIRRFAAHAGCNSDNPLMLPNINMLNSIEGSETTVLAYPDCPEGVDVELWTLVGAPHIPVLWNADGMDSVVDWMIDHRRG